MAARRTRLILASGALLGVVLLAAAGCLLVRPEVRSLAAPLLGPWAGHLYGHSECTLASASPLLAAGLVALGAVSAGLGLAVRRRRGWPRAVAFGMQLAFVLGWSSVALLSVVNTMS